VVAAIRRPGPGFPELLMYAAKIASQVPFKVLIALRCLNLTLGYHLFQWARDFRCKLQRVHWAGHLEPQEEDKFPVCLTKAVAKLIKN
jgi:hypothetical protein